MFFGLDLVQNATTKASIRSPESQAVLVLQVSVIMTSDKKATNGGNYWGNGAVSGGDNWGQELTWKQAVVW